MADIKVLIFFLGCWVSAIMGMAIYRGAFIDKDIKQDLKSKLFHSISTSIIALLVAGYILHEYPAAILESRRTGPYFFVGFSSGIIWNITFSPVYETYIDYINGNFD